MPDKKEVEVEVLKPLRKPGVLKTIQVGKKTKLDEDTAKKLEVKRVVKIITAKTNIKNITGDIK